MQKENALPRARLELAFPRPQRGVLTPILSRLLLLKQLARIVIYVQLRDKILPNPVCVSVTDEPIVSKFTKVFCLIEIFGICDSVSYFTPVEAYRPVVFNIGETLQDSTPHV